MTNVTIYTLFFDDLRIIFFKKSADNIFYNLSFAAMIIYTLEFLISCYAIKGYFFTFFFFLDLISIVTMLPDIGWLFEIIT